MGSHKTPTLLSVCEPVAEMLIEVLTPVCEKGHVQVGGSYGRFLDARDNDIEIGDPTCNDLDVALIPSGEWSEVETAMNSIGEHLSGKTWMVEGVPVDLMPGESGAWGAILAHCMGDGRYNIKMRAKAKALHKKLGHKRTWLSQYGLFAETSEGETITLAGDTQESIWKALGITYKPPRERFSDGLDARISK